LSRGKLGTSLAKRLRSGFFSVSVPGKTRAADVLFGKYPAYLQQKKYEKIIQIARNAYDSHLEMYTV
jgi:hypothetical protein